MIARCDYCDQRLEARGFGHHHATGHRYDPRVGPASAHRCQDCGRALRPKRRGESEQNIVTARPPARPTTRGRRRPRGKQ